MVTTCLRARFKQRTAHAFGRAGSKTRLLYPVLQLRIIFPAKATSAFAALAHLSRPCHPVYMNCCKKNGICLRERPASECRGPREVEAFSAAHLQQYHQKSGIAKLAASGWCRKTGNAFRSDKAKESMSCCCSTLCLSSAKKLRYHGISQVKGNLCLASQPYEAKHCRTFVVGR